MKAEPHETARAEIFFPVFPSPLDDSGESKCKYYGDKPNQARLNVCGGYYNADTDRINIPYSELRDSVVVPYSYWCQVIQYAADTEAAVRAVMTE